MSVTKSFVFRQLQSLTHRRTDARRRFRQPPLQSLRAVSEDLEARCLLTSPSLSLSDISLLEGNQGRTSAVLTVTLDAASELPVSVDYMTRGISARAGFDFAGASGTITIPAGVLSAQLPILICGDATDEQNETFSVVLSAPRNGSLGQSTALITIKDDDLPPALSIQNVKIAEGNEGATVANVKVSLSAVSELPVSFNFATKDGTALSGTHYGAASGVVTIPAGQKSTVLPISIMTDRKDEWNKSFEVLLTGATNAAISNGISSVKIVDDDPRPVVSVLSGGILEGDLGSASIFVEIALDTVSELPVSFTYQTRDLSAVAGSDYQSAKSRRTIPAGQTTVRIALNINGDLIHEADETFELILTAVTNGLASATTSIISILNNDVPSSVRVEDVQVVEGETSDVYLTLNKVSSFPITIQYATANQTALSPRDFTSTTGSITIPAGMLTAAIRVPTINDLTDEPDEAFLLKIISVVNATIADDSGLISVIDNDPPAVAIEDVTVIESDTGFTQVTVAIYMSSKSPDPVSFRFQTRELSARDGLDFVVSSGTVLIPAGSRVGRCTLVIANDLLDEFDEVFEVILSAPQGATLRKSAGRITITDNDIPPVITIQNNIVTEEDSTSSFLLVSLSTVSGRPVTVDIRAKKITASTGEDFSLVQDTVTIPAGELSANVPFMILDDAIDEPHEAFSLNLSAASGAVLGQSTGIVTIKDNDGPDLPLFEMSDLAYLGAFRVPTGAVGSASFEFGGGAITFNPNSNSLFLSSNINDGLSLAEIAIPTGLVSSGLVTDMQSAAILQPFVNLGSLLTTNAAGKSTPPLIGYENLNLGGLLVAGNGLTGGMFMGYNGAEPENSTHSHFRTTSLNLSGLNSTSFAGLVDIRKNSNSSTGRIRGGYMAAVPEQWRAWVGYDYVTGAAGQNRIQFSSSGPALFGFNAENPAASSGNALLAYPYGHALQWTDAPSAPMPIFNGTTIVSGVAFVPGTRSVIFLGSNGLSSIGYGDGRLFNDTARPYSGFHSQNGNYKYQIWAYDIDDFVSVRNGTKPSWGLRPTSVLNFDLPTPEPSKYLGGTAFDPATGRLYVSQKFAGPNSTPIIHVYQLGRTSGGKSSSAGEASLALPRAISATSSLRKTASDSLQTSATALVGNNTPTAISQSSRLRTTTTAIPNRSTAQAPRTSASTSMMPVDLTDNLFASLDLNLDFLN